MLKLSTTSDNVGGVTRIVAIPVSSFRRVTFNVITRRRSLTLYDISNCIEIECNRSEEASDECSDNNEGLSYIHQLHGKIFSLDGERLGLVNVLARGHWILLVRDGNGVYKLFGSVDVPLNFTYRNATGQHRSGSSALSYTFQSTQPEPAVIIDSHPL